MIRVALYPGSFDPITNGHLDIVQRALRLFDEVHIGIGHNAKKKGGLFTVEERIELIDAAIRETIGVGPIAVGSFSELVTKAAERHGACAIVRGMRALSDFEFEFQFAHMAKRLNPRIEPIFPMTSEENFYCSSSIVKEVVGAGGSRENIEGLVPRCVAEAVFEKMRPGE